ncbi:MAG: DUF1972 domain-containing protein [Pseudomonadota bacterium]|nr:DUF1972 domain-containing protein [Pseudomonadota bacterium]
MSMLEKKVLIVGTVGLPAKYGGWETLVHYLTKYLSSKINFTVVCSSKNYTEKLKKYNNAKLVYLPLSANGMASIIYDLWSIIRFGKGHDVILILGVSGCIFLPILKWIGFTNKKKIIVNIDGMEWRRQKWGFFAKRFLRISEKCAVSSADLVLSDNEGITKYINEQYKKDCIEIPYGGDQAVFEELCKEDKIYQEIHQKDYYFSVARIEPENNIHMILKAFSSMPERKLVIVGNWDNSNYGASLLKCYAQYKNILMIGAIYDLKLLNAMRSNAYGYIHGHSAGGTNPSLVEAMMLGLPIFAFDVVFNRATTFSKAYYFQDEEQLKTCIQKTDTSCLIRSGITLKELAKKHYLWSRVASQYLNALTAT